MLLAIDPGKRACGVCLIFPPTREIFRAGYVKGHPNAEGPQAWGTLARAVLDWTKGSTVLQVVFEQPGAYRSDTPSKTLNLQDLIGVAAWVCALHPAAFPRRLRPREWKGTIDGDQMVWRVQRRVAAKELARIELPSAKGVQHNVWDAIGIALYCVGRLEPVKVIPR